MTEGSQIVVPPSFIALFVPQGRIKPTASAKEIADRYEICEDLATALADQARTILWELGIAEHDVLERIHRGLSADGSPVSSAESIWVTRRLAEVLGWEDYTPPGDPSAR